MVVKCEKCIYAVFLGKNDECLLYECKKLNIYVENGVMLKCPLFFRKSIELPEKEEPVVEEYLIEEFERERIPS